ncbi:MAG TPA: hypothetical protein VFM41_05800 [Gaiella sp.]|nr:hypothetical protein [Gaiella sp.]
MSPLGIGARDVALLARYQRRALDVRGPLVVGGVLAEQLARELRAGGDPTLVRTGGEPAEAAAYVRVVAGAATAEDERLLRVATRALVPVVVVQTADVRTRIPYALPEDVVQCAPGRGFPVDEIAERLAVGLREHGGPLAASLPFLRDAVERRRALEGAIAAGTLAALERPEGSDLPLLAIGQARMLSDISAAEGGEPANADGAAAAQALATTLGAAVVAGHAARALVRRLPRRSRLLDGLVAAGGTLALAAAFRRLPRS